MRSSYACLPWLLALGLVVASPLAGSAQVARAQLVASGLSTPLFATTPPGDPRLFIVQRGGQIRILKDGVLLPTPFLDITSLTSPFGAGEGGLLGLAFPADYATSGLFTVYYTNPSFDSVVARYSVSANPDVASTPGQILLQVDQPDGPAFQNHKGGTVQYGPDGFLWFALGDGGSADDPNELAQNPQSLLGKMLRIDVGPVFAGDSIEDEDGVATPYKIPADNPFVGSAPQDEIWALGFRNPYRFSFDRGTGDLWIADVGQSAREEVDHELATDAGGRNYGWDVMEGTACHEVVPGAPPCDSPALTLPVHEYPHSAGNCSITGGYVYRADFSGLAGRYFFGDWCTGRVWSLGTQMLDLVEHTGQLGIPAPINNRLVGFGEDHLGRLLLVHSSGNVYRLGPPPPSAGWGCGLGPELALVLGALAGAGRLRARARPPHR